jgi:uncharacterized protein YkwD
LDLFSNKYLTAMGMLALFATLPAPVHARPEPLESSPIKTLDAETLQSLSRARSLEDMINEKRTINGRTTLRGLPDLLARENLAYGRDVLRNLHADGSCDHAFGQWENFQRRMEKIEVIVPMSEVLACPRPSNGWSAIGVVQMWQKSPVHNSILFEKDNRTNIGCAVADYNGKTAALCTLWKPLK